MTTPTGYDRCWASKATRIVNRAETVDGTHKLPLFFTGSSVSPQCFKCRSPALLGLEHSANKKAWMTSSIFSEWLTASNQLPVSKRNPDILLLIDNYRAYGKVDTLPLLPQVEAMFFPSTMTSKISAARHRMIAPLNVRYVRRHLECAVNLDDINESDIYKIDISTVTKWLCSV